MGARAGRGVGRAARATPPQLPRVSRTRRLRHAGRRRGARFVPDRLRRGRRRLVGHLAWNGARAAHRRRAANALVLARVERADDGRADLRLAGSRARQWSVPVSPSDQERLLLGLRVSEFLIAEAALLDEWKLEEWLALFT